MKDITGKIKIKVCGMRNPANIEKLIKLDIDYIGFIFYKKSPRYVGHLSRDVLKQIPGDMHSVGVFVNGEPCLVSHTIQSFSLDYIQLHGDESPEYCMRIKQEQPGIRIIKAFGIMDTIDNELLKTYTGVADFFLFDTSIPGYGGSGKSFNRDILRHYNLDIPFFLSGGIDESILKDKETLSLPGLHALDINSRFETVPGEKNIRHIETFIEKLNHHVKDKRK